MPPAATAAIVQEEVIATEAALAATVTVTAPAVTTAIETGIVRAVAKHPSQQLGRSSYKSSASENSVSPSADHAESSSQNKRHHQKMFPLSRLKTAPTAAVSAMR